MGQRGRTPVDGCRAHVINGLWSLLLATIIVLTGSAGPAAAHTSLVRSFPEADARLTAPVAELWLEFETPLAEGGHEVAVTGPGGSSKVVGEPTVSGNVIRVQVPPMTDVGEYRVSYRMVSLDGHLLDGDYRFSIRAVAAGQSVAAGPDEPTSAATDEARSGIGDSRVLWVGLGSMLFAVAGAALMLRRSQRRGRERAPSLTA